MILRLVCGDDERGSDEYSTSNASGAGTEEAYVATPVK